MFDISFVRCGCKLKRALTKYVQSPFFFLQSWVYFIPGSNGFWLLWINISFNNQMFLFLFPWSINKNCLFSGRITEHIYCIAVCEGDWTLQFWFAEQVQCLI